MQAILADKTELENMNPGDDNWIKEIIYLNDQIEELQKPINNIPATVGEYYTTYFEKYNK